MSKLDNAKGLYLEGIRDGNAHEALARYTGARYTQHSTGVPDGKEGFLAFFEPFLERNPVRDIQIVRGLQDGNHVWLQAYQDLNNGQSRWVTGDLFDTDDQDRMIEHWDSIQAFEPDSVSGRSMVDGPTDIEDLEHTDANKELVRRFTRAVLTEADHHQAGSFLAVDLHQHNPQIADGLDAYLDYLRRHDVRYTEVHHLIGQGNFVVTYARKVIDGQDHATFDLYRIADGIIVEHWDVEEKILPESEWGNRGKF
ncbi:MAG: hypothetical protein AAGD38_07740 [Acidobacteriota bacterium]